MGARAVCHGLPLYFYMETRIATCNPCGLEFYDLREKRSTGNRCKAYQQERATKINKWKRFIADEREKGKFVSMLNLNVIQMHWREGLRVPEMVEILGMTEREVKLEINIARQNAR